MANKMRQTSLVAKYSSWKSRKLMHNVLYPLQNCYFGHFLPKYYKYGLTGILKMTSMKGFKR